MKKGQNYNYGGGGGSTPWSATCIFNKSKGGQL